MTPESIHALLLAESDRVQLPQHWKTDVTVRDLEELAETGSQRFIWVLRTCGSHLVRMDDQQTAEQVPAWRYKMLPSSFLDAIARTFSDDGKLYYHFDGSRLEPVTLDRAREITCTREPEPAATELGTGWYLGNR